MDTHCISQEGKKKVCELKFICLPVYWATSFLCAFSSSLDALVATSEEEGRPEQPHTCSSPVPQSPSRTGVPSEDELDSFESNIEPYFNISRTESLSLSSNLQLKVFWLLLNSAYCK